jgi:hypothetical protein
MYDLKVVPFEAQGYGLAVAVTVTILVSDGVPGAGQGSFLNAMSGIYPPPTSRKRREIWGTRGFESEGEGSFLNAISLGLCDTGCDLVQGTVRR